MSPAKIYTTASVATLLTTTTQTRAFAILTEAASITRDNAAAEMERREGAVLYSQGNVIKMDEAVARAQEVAAIARATVATRIEERDQQQEELADCETALLELSRAPALLAANVDGAVLSERPQSPLVLWSKPWVFGKVHKRNRLDDAPIFL